MALFGDVHVKAGYPVKEGESILWGAHLSADPLTGMAGNYDPAEKYIGMAVLPMNNADGADGQRSVAVAIDGLAVDDVSDFVAGTTAIGDALYLDGDKKPVVANTDPQQIGEIVSLLGGKRVVYRIVV